MSRWPEDQDTEGSSLFQSMRSVGQVDSETRPSDDPKVLAGHMFGDMGVVYIRYCDGCNILATGGRLPLKDLEKLRVHLVSSAGRP